jgi:diacylglycerol kinase family enzyme
MDAGLLGLAVAHAGSVSGSRRQLLSEWTADEFVVEADGAVPVGVDGEALMMSSPVVIRIRPGALRVRIASQHPGASPSYALPTGIADGVKKAVRIAAGTDPQHA